MKLSKTLALLIFPAVLLCSCGNETYNIPELEIPACADQSDEEARPYFTLYECEPDPETKLCTFENDSYKLSYPEYCSLFYAEKDGLVEIEITYTGANCATEDRYSCFSIRRFELEKGESLKKRIKNLFKAYDMAQNYSSAKLEKIPVGDDKGWLLSYFWNYYAYAGCYVQKDGVNYAASMRCMSNPTEMEDFANILRSWELK